MRCKRLAASSDVVSRLFQTHFDRHRAICGAAFAEPGVSRGSSPDVLSKPSLGRLRPILGDAGDALAFFRPILGELDRCWATSTNALYFGPILGQCWTMLGEFGQCWASSANYRHPKHRPLGRRRGRACLSSAKRQELEFGSNLPLMAVQPMWAKACLQGDGR